jgi:hypothetical protein
MPNRLHKEHLATIAELKGRLTWKWKPREWSQVLAFLEGLSDPELRDLAATFGIEFVGGSEAVKDYPEILARHQFIYHLLIKADTRRLLLLSAKNKLG